MTLKAQVATLTLTSLNDVRSAGVALALEDLLFRKDFGGGISQYRIYLKGTEIPITSMAELLTHVHVDKISLAHNVGVSSAAFKDKTKPIWVILSTLEVRFDKYAEDDNYYTSVFGSGEKKSIVIVMGYVGDNDPDLPIKALDLLLYSANLITP